jgi:hypothetical protein
VHSHLSGSSHLAQPVRPVPAAYDLIATSLPVKKFPVVSLLLLLAAYGTFSWFLYQSTAPWIVWVVVTTVALTEALLLTTLSQGLRAAIRKWLKSDIGYFSIVLIGAFSIALVLVWHHIFEYIFLILAAEILARLDLQMAGLNRWQSLAVLSIVSLLGLAIGWVANRAFFPAIEFPALLLTLKFN